ncbi:MAG: hypothetical protein ABI355_14195 [Solirubrobacteraceae bacterium]
MTSTPSALASEWTYEAVLGRRLFPGLNNAGCQARRGRELHHLARRPRQPARAQLARLPSMIAASTERACTSRPTQPRTSARVGSSMRLWSPRGGPARTASIPTIALGTGRLHQPGRTTTSRWSKCSVVVEVTRAPDKVEAFKGLVRPFGLTQMARTGEIAISRGRSET